MKVFEMKQDQLGVDHGSCTERIGGRLQQQPEDPLSPTSVHDCRSNNVNYLSPSF